MSKFVGVIIGGAEIVAGAILLATGNPAGVTLIVAGIGTVIAGVGTLLQKGPLTGIGSASRNPIAPWNVVYGRARVGGTIVYINEFGEADKYLDLVIVLAAHPCESVDSLLFDGQRLRLDANGDSFRPPSDQTGPNIVSISRTNGVVTVTMASSITDLQTGDFLIIKNVTTDKSLNGRFAVTVTANPAVLTYICGGFDVSISGQGQTQTTWMNYREKVHMEILLGDHVATFPGMINGTPYDGDPSNLVKPENQTSPSGNPNGSDNPWTSQHLLLGKCCVFLRLHYNDEVFAAGLPNIAFLLSGKKDIFDPRSNTNGYTTNSALCIADYLSNTTWGFKAVYGTDIPANQLIAAANVCDEQVPLSAGGTESRYTCNGTFPLTLKRGEVLQNLLTSCAGRIAYTGGEFIIQPAGCVGVSLSLPLKPIASMAFTLVASHTPNNEDNTMNATAGALVTVGPYDANGHPLAYITGFPGSSWTTPNLVQSVTVGIPVSTDLTILAVTNELAYSGGSFTDGDPGLGWIPEAFNFFDAYVDVVYADGSTARFRSLEIVRFNNDFIATDTQTQRWHFSNFGTPAVLRWQNFTNLVTVGPSSSPPDFSPQGIAESGAALAEAAGPFRWRPKVPIRDLYNAVKGTYISPVNNWQSSDFPPYAQDEKHGYFSGSPTYPFGDANLFADGGDRRYYDIQLPFTISVATAQRLAKIELLRRRLQGTGTFIYNMALYTTTVLDIIAMTLPVLGWTNKVLEVIAHRFTLNKVRQGDQDVVLLGTELDLQEYDCTIFDWSTTEELTAEGFQQPTLPPNTGVISGVTPKVNAQTGVSTYQFVATDRGNTVSFNNGSTPVLATLTTAGFLQNQLDEFWHTTVENTGTAPVTIQVTPHSGQTIDGQGSIVLPPNQGLQIFSDGTSFYTERGISLGGGAGYVIETIVAGAITPDISRGLWHEVTLVSNTPLIINNAIWGAASPPAPVPAGIEFAIVIVQDGTGRRPTPTWGSAYLGSTGFEIGGDANSRSTFRFVARGDGHFERSTAPDPNVTPA